MSGRTSSNGFTAQTDDAEIHDGTLLVRGEGLPTEWFDGDSVNVTLADGRTVLFIAMPAVAPNLFSWSIPGEPIRRAYLDHVGETTVRVRLTTTDALSVAPVNIVRC